MSAAGERGSSESKKPSSSSSSGKKDGASASKEGWKPESFPADRFRIDRGRPLTDGTPCHISSYTTLWRSAIFLPLSTSQTNLLPILPCILFSPYFRLRRYFPPHSRCVSTDIVAYFVQMGTELELADTLEADHRAALLGNLWAEVRGREFRIATKKETAVVLERLIELSTYGQIKTFLRALRKKYYAFFVHHSASHCMQRLLMRTPEIMLKEHVEQVVVPWDSVGSNPDPDSPDAETAVGNNSDDDDDEAEAEAESGSGDEGGKAAKGKKGKGGRRIWADKPMQDILYDMCYEVSPYWLDLMTNPQVRIA